jgi:NitT/TauT family transport system permease protein
MQKHVAGHARHMHVHYPQSLSQRLYGHVLVPLLVLLVAGALMQGYSVTQSEHAPNLTLILAALGATFARLALAYVLSLVVAVPLALLVTHNALAERIFLPFFDIMQSLPVLAFFPVIIVFFVHWGLYDAAAIFVLFVTMLWSIVFSLVGGLHAIPRDILYAGKIFGLRGVEYIKKILLPSAVPYLVTGSLLAWAAGWNIVIVAEVLHTYLPAVAGQPASATDLFGIGSLLVNSAAMGQQQTFFAAIIVMIFAIAALNLFVWQGLLRYAERYKFE